MIGCEDPASTEGEAQGCDQLDSPCPEGTVCQSDAVGNPFCAPEVDPPLTMGGTMSSGGTNTAGDSTAGEATLSQS